MKKKQKLMFIAMLVSLGVIVSIVEKAIPIPIPGVKLGLANVVTLVSLYVFDTKTAFVVAISRVIISSLLSGTFMSIGFILAMSGMLLSFIGMSAVKKTNLFSVYGVSILGASLHSLSQVTMVSILLNVTGIVYLLPIMVIVSILTGWVSGFVSEKLIKKYKFMMEK